MKIGVMSDTHLRGVSEGLKRIVEEHFKEADLILHAGDIVAGPVLAYLEAAGVIAVRGNMDLPEVARALPTKRVIRAGDFRIGLIHGWGNPHGLADRLRPEFDRIDALVFGHSHSSANYRVGPELYFNPGPAGYSIGLLHVTDRIEGEIIIIRSQT